MLGRIPFALVRLGMRINKRTPLIPRLRSTVHSKTSTITVYEALIAANEKAT